MSGANKSSASSKMEHTGTDLDEVVADLMPYETKKRSAQKMTQGEEGLVQVSRQYYTQNHLDEVYPLPVPEPPLSTCKGLMNRCRCSKDCLKRTVLSFLPIINVLKTYRQQLALPDMISGLSVAFLHVPQGLGYGLLASLGAAHGLYSSFFPTVVYMIFGTSPHVSMGTNAVMALLVASVVNREANFYLHDHYNHSTVDPEQILQLKVAVASALNLLEGLILIGMGLLRLGFLTNFMSHSFIEGYSFAAAVHIFVSQLVKLLNLQLHSRSGLGKLVFTIVDIVQNITDTNVGDVLVGLVCFVILLGFNMGINVRYRHRLKVPVPIELFVVILSTVISHFAELNQRFNIAVVGDVAQGIPAPSLPSMHFLPRIVRDSFVHAVLIFVLTISLAKLTAKLHVITIDDNQELVAYGLCQLVGSFFKNFSSSISPPRTMMLSTTGAKSTLNGLTTAVFLLLVLLVGGQLLVSLPIAMLAAMIIVAMKGLLLQLKTLWYVNKGDFFIWLLTASFSVFGDLDVGLLVGVVSSMVVVMVYSMSAKGVLLGKAPDEDIYMDMDRKGINPISGVKIFRFETQLHFASAERFKSEMYEKIFDPTNVKRKDFYEIEVQPRRESVFSVMSDGTHQQQSSVTRDTVVSLETSQASPPPERSGQDALSMTSINRTPSGGSAVSPSSMEIAPVVQPDSTPQTARRSGSVRISYDSNPPFINEDRLQYVILDCSTLTYVDMTGVEMLHLIIAQYARAGVVILLTDIPSSTLAILTRAKFFDHEDGCIVYFSTLDALHAINLMKAVNVT